MLGPENVSLEGKVALVTGAAQGIGEAIALTFANFGASIAMCDRNADGLAFVSKTIDELGQRVVTGVMDVRDADQVDAFVDDAVRALDHRIDVLVNNAGGGFPADFLDVNAKGQDALIRENFSSVTHFVRACAPHMPEGGSIINITSIEAHRAAPGFAIYSAMKAGVANLTQSLALELGSRLIRVNCIAPDVIPTPGLPDLADVSARMPLPTMGNVDDVAGAALFLASELSRFVTGTTIHVDGGNVAAGGWHRQPDGRWHP
ncbi:MAG: 3-oxoacyl-[acyl-carrier protein] reductase [Acidimicrobiaceae bacterium]|jgi:NAD(P)-dependent dehydrogenase (short-subunit alcohol dehydrogenase family)